MKNKLILSGLLLIVILLGSCSKNEEDVLTPGEINAQKIQSVIDTEKPSSVSVYEFQWDEDFNEYDWEFVVGTSNFVVEGAFIKVEKYYFNLEKLHRFRMNGATLEVYLNIE